MLNIAAALLVAVAAGAPTEPSPSAPASQPSQTTGSPDLAKPATPTPAPAQTNPEQTKSGEEPKPAEKSTDAYVLGFTMQDIDGKDVDLAQYKGRVVMLVNVASKCGYTPQYVGLEKLYKEKSSKGFVILGFPANDFGEQEPGTNSDIKAFCSSKYNVTFPMFAKISVRGSEQHPLFRKISSQPKPLGGEGVPGWNFTKFLVDRNGNVVAKFDSKVKPDDPALVKKVDELLAGK